MLIRKVRRRNQIALLDLRGSIPVSSPQDFDAIRQQVREPQAQKIIEDRKHFSPLSGVTMRVPGVEEI